MANIITSRTINNHDVVKTTKINNELRIIHNSYHNTVARMQKLDSNTGLNLETGEVIEFKRSQNRSQRMCDFKRSLSMLRDIIKLNVVELKKCFFITLTYEDNISDREVLKKDFDNFIRKFRRRFGNCEYINAIEYQNRGALHCHLIVIFDEIPTFTITNDDIKKCWKHGSSNIGPVTSAEADAKYLTNFLFEYKVEKEDSDNIFKTKKQRKGERVCYYPSHSRLFNCSQGIKRPEVIKNIPYSEALSMFNSIELTNALSIYNDDGNIVTIENYKINNEKEVC